VLLLLLVVNPGPAQAQDPAIEGTLTLDGLVRRDLAVVVADVEVLDAVSEGDVQCGVSSGGAEESACRIEVSKSTTGDEPTVHLREAGVCPTLWAAAPGDSVTVRLPTVSGATPVVLHWSSEQQVPTWQVQAQSCGDSILIPGGTSGPFDASDVMIRGAAWWHRAEAASGTVTVPSEARDDVAAGLSRRAESVWTAWMDANGSTWPQNVRCATRADLRFEANPTVEILAGHALPLDTGLAAADLPLAADVSREVRATVSARGDRGADPVECLLEISRTADKLVLQPAQTSPPDSSAALGCPVIWRALPADELHVVFDIPDVGRASVDVRVSTANVGDALESGSCDRDAIPLPEGADVGTRVWLRGVDRWHTLEVSATAIAIPSTDRFRVGYALSESAHVSLWWSDGTAAWLGSIRCVGAPRVPVSRLTAEGLTQRLIEVQGIDIPNGNAALSFSHDGSLVAACVAVANSAVPGQTILSIKGQCDIFARAPSELGREYVVAVRGGNHQALFRLVDAIPTAPAVSPRYNVRVAPSGDSVEFDSALSRVQVAIHDGSQWKVLSPRPQDTPEADHARAVARAMRSGVAEALAWTTSVDAIWIQLALETGEATEIPVASWCNRERIEHLLAPTDRASFKMEIVDADCDVETDCLLTRAQQRQVLHRTHYVCVDATNPSPSLVGTSSDDHILPPNRPLIVVVRHRPQWAMWLAVSADPTGVGETDEQVGALGADEASVESQPGVSQPVRTLGDGTQVSTYSLAPRRPGTYAVDIGGGTATDAGDVKYSGVPLRYEFIVLRSVGGAMRLGLGVGWRGNRGRGMEIIEADGVRRISHSGGRTATELVVGYSVYLTNRDRHYRAIRDRAMGRATVRPNVGLYFGLGLITVLPSGDAYEPFDLFGTLYSGLEFAPSPHVSIAATAAFYRAESPRGGLSVGDIVPSGWDNSTAFRNEYRPAGAIVLSFDPLFFRTAARGLRVLETSGENGQQKEGE
jgi:hypothetical protein